MDLPNEVAWSEPKQYESDAVAVETPAGEKSAATMPVETEQGSELEILLGLVELQRRQLDLQRLDLAEQSGRLAALESGEIARPIQGA